MNIVEKFTVIMNSYLKRRAIRRIRKEMYLLNCPVDQYSDEQIEEGLIYLVRVFARMGYTMEDFSTAAKTFAKQGV